MSEKPCGAYFFAFFEKFVAPILTSGGYVGLSIATLLSQHHQVTAGEAKKGEFQFQLNANHDLLFPISYHIRNQFPKTPALVLPIMADVTEFPFVPKEMDVCRFILPANGMMKDALPEMLHGLALLTREELSRLEFHFTGVAENQIKSILNSDAIYFYLLVALHYR